MPLSKPKNQDGFIIIVMFTGMGTYLMLFMWVLLLASETGLAMAKLSNGNKMIGLLFFALFLLSHQLMPKHKKTEHWLAPQAWRVLSCLQILALSFAFGSLLSMFLLLGI